MDTASVQFILFGLAVVLVTNVSHARAWRASVLLVASAIFLGMLAHNPVTLLPLIGFLLLGYFGMLLMAWGVPKAPTGSLLVMIFAYVWLKKYTLLPEFGLLHFSYFTLGLSYIFFRVLHLLIEAGEGHRRISLGAYLLYTLNFTTLVSGPIQRYDEFARDQFAEAPIPLGPRVVGRQLERIVYGFFKVNVLAMLLHAAQQDALADLALPLPPLQKFYAAIRLTALFPLFLYANFSGYIDIVIALARLMRLRLPENFDRPFSASCFIDFWTRWHITLSNWLKSYVYNPLLVALMRRITAPALEPFLGVFCFFVTFFLVGVWHGRTSEFLFFGLLQGGGVAINKLWQLVLTRRLGRKRSRALAVNPLYVAMGRGLTYSWFAFTLFWFWADWKQIAMVFHALGPLEWCGMGLALWLLAAATLAMWEVLRTALLSIRSGEGPLLCNRYARVVFASAVGLAAFVITFLLSQPAPDLVYKAF
jgi:D-alanyl-lipoteichoic acid acyltransferase DltB (MBOAT superfamily)